MSEFLLEQNPVERDESILRNPTIRDVGGASILPGNYRQIVPILFNPALAITAEVGRIAVPVTFAGKLMAVRAQCFGASTSGAIEVSLQDDSANEILSTNITIDEGEYTSMAATAQPVINPSYAVFARSANIYCTIESAGTGATGLWLELYFLATIFYQS